VDNFFVLLNTKVFKGWDGAKSQSVWGPTMGIEKIVDFSGGKVGGKNHASQITFQSVGENRRKAWDKNDDIPKTEGKGFTRYSN